MPKKTLNVAVIGVGVMGQHHARNYHSLRETKLVAVCDTDPRIGKEIAKKYDTKYYQNHQDLIREEPLDAASIVVPTKQHKKIALDFIENKIPILVEKPLAYSSREARQIVETAKKNNVLLAVGHIERFNPAVIKLRELVEKGAVGQILSLNIKRVGVFPPRVKDVNVVSDLAVHDLDVAVSLAKRDPEKIFAVGGGALTNGREDHAEIFLDFGSFGCFIQVNWVTPIKIRQLSITGTKGYAELNYITQEINFYKSLYTIKSIKQPAGFEDFVVFSKEQKAKKVKTSGEEPLKLEILNFVNSIKRKEKPIVKGEDGLRAVMLSEIVNRSIKNQKVINVRL